MNTENQLKLAIVALVFLASVFIQKAYNSNEAQQFAAKTNPIQSTKISNKSDNDPIEIHLNPISELNGVSAAEIEKKRAALLKDSPLKIKNYKMNRNVNQIVDGIPWIALPQLTCFGVTPDIAKGPSRESVNLNNPLLLISLSVNTFGSKDSSYCSSADYLLPESLTYYPKENLLSAVFPVKPFVDGFKIVPTRSDYGRKVDLSYFGWDLFLINETNARDLGYNYGYADKNNGVFFKSKNNNLLTDVYKFTSFVHKGNACGLPSGCNNISPYSDSKSAGLEFFPSYIRIKLWKNKPLSKYAKADLNYEMIFK